MALPSGITLRYRVGSISGVADGLAIASLPESSGAGHPAAAQATSNKQPIARAVTNNGKSFFAANFDGTDDSLALSGTALSVFRNLSGATVFIIASTAVRATSTAKSLFHSSNGSSITQARIAMASGVFASAQGAWRVGGRRADTDAITWAESTTLPVISAWGVLTGQYIWSANDAFSYYNGTQIASNTAYLAAGVTANTAALGSALGSAANGTSEYWNGRIAEIIVYPRSLTTAERADVHSYIQDEYGITVSDYVAPVTPPTGNVFSEWNGTTRVPLTVRGEWNGTTVVPLTYRTTT